MYKHPQKPSAAPSSEAVWARPVTRQHTVRLALLAVLFGSLAAFSIYALVSGAFTADDPARTVAVIMIVICGGVAVAAVLAMATLPKRTHSMPAIAVDAEGVWWIHRDHAMLTAWQDLAGVGTSFKLSPRQQAAPASCPYAYAFEAYLRDTTLDKHPQEAILRRWLVNEDAPHPSMPRQRLRYLLPAAAARHQLHRTVGHYAPQLWVGEHERRWTSVRHGHELS